MKKNLNDNNKELLTKTIISNEILKKDLLVKNNKIYNYNINKIKINIIKILNEKNFIKIILFIINIYIFFFFFSYKNKISKSRKLNSDFSEIIIVIKGTGEKQIISNDIPLPDKVIINGNETFSNNTIYYLPNEENIIEIIWYNQLTTCSKMFRNLNYIIKIDLSKFNSSLISDMSNMFESCKNLISIDFTNFDTSLVTNMTKMFYSIESMTSLDLSNFNTQKVIGMDCLFEYDKNLEYINLKSFNTSSVKYMKSMFKGCLKLTSINLTNFNTKSLMRMNSMFYNCKSLVNLDLSSFNISKITDLANVFGYCENLEKVNLKSFDTSSVTSMKWMFLECKNLKSLDISNFNMSKVRDISYMFRGCENLEYIDFNNLLSISSINEANFLFYNCKKLQYLDLSFMKISKVNDLKYMFYNCENLKYLNLLNFDTLSVTDMEYMFDNCNSLKYLNMPFFIENNNLNLTNIFNNISTDLIYCIKEESKAKNLISLLDEQDNSINDCSNICFSENAKFIIEKDVCIEDCNNDEYFNYEYKKLCYKNCSNYFYTYENKCYNEIPEGYYLNNSELKFLDKCPTKCKICSNESIKYNLCLSCMEEYAPLETDIMEEKYFLDCFKVCPKGYISINDSCIINEIPCENNIKYEIYKDNICVEDCNIYDFLNEICGPRNNSINVKNEIINNVINSIINGELNLEEIAEGFEKDIEIYENDIKYQITSTYNQKNKKYDNISSINLGECEIKLKNYYKIPEQKSLIIFKIDIYEEGLLIPKIEYTVFEPINYQKLNLSICNDIKINLFLPKNISEEELYKHNLSSDFYNDNCFPYTSENGTDVTLEDRKNEYINNNLFICESNCKFVGYDKNANYINCECKIKNEINIFSSIKLDKDELLNSFIDVGNFLNFEVLKCYYILFTKQGLLYNIGSYIIMFTILIYIILLIFFIIKGYKFLINQIYIIIKQNKNVFLEKNNIQIYMKKEKNQNNSKKKIKKIVIKENTIDKHNLEKDSLQIDLSNNKNAFKVDDNINNSESSKSNIMNKKNENLNINKIDKNNSIDVSFIIIDGKKILNLNDNEFNSLKYLDALKYDKRAYFQYYFSLLRTKHLLIFSFFSNKDYNSKTIKICLFLFSFDLYFTINALFFTYDKVHKIYEDSGNFNFIYNLPHMIYSIIISSFINIIMKNLALSEKNLLKIKNEKDIEKYKDIVPKEIKCLKIKFFLFFIFSFLFLFLSWYYLSCFCAVYKNTEIHLIEDTLISFIISLLYPFITNLIPGIFRIYSLRLKNKEYIYNFNKII